MNKAKVILLVSLGVSFLGLGLLGVWVGMMVKGHHRVLALGGARLGIVPVEEVWEATEEGEEISLGYMSFWLEPNEIESVRTVNGLLIYLILKDGLNFRFSQPFGEDSVEDVIPYQDNNMTRQEAEEILWWTNYFEGKKEVYSIQPLTDLEYIWLNSKERYVYYRHLVVKSLDVCIEKGIVIFNGDHTRGIYLRGNKDGSEAHVEIFGKGLGIRQVIIVRSAKGVTEPEEEAKIKRILGSMRYLVEELPGEGELAAMVAEAVGRMKNDK